MAYINAISDGNQPRVLVRVNDGTDPVVSDFLTTGTGSPVAHTVNAGTLDLDGLQSITVNNTPGTFRWQTLDSASENVITTVNVNSVSSDFVLDENKFFGVDSAGTDADDKGVFNLSNEKTQVDVLVAFNGIREDDHIVIAKGYITGIAPNTTPTAPVWVSPITIEVDGDYTYSQLGATIS